MRAEKGRFWSAAILLVLLVTFGLFWRALVLGETFFDRDLASFYRPAKGLILPLAQASGGIPLWNPLFAAGQPFAANPEHEIFHPLTTLFFLLPFEWAFRLQVVLPLLAGVGSMFLFLRTLRRSRPAALLGALSWGFGGYLLSTTNLLPILLAASIIPLTLSFIVRLARRPSAMDVAGLALSFGLQALAGEPSTLLMMPGLGLAAAVMRRRVPGRAWLTVVAGIGLGAALAATTLLPGIHHAGDTIRARGLTDSMANEWSMPAVRALDLLSPHVLGHVARGNPGLYWGRSLYGEKTFAYYYSLYPGLLVSVLGIAALCLRRRRLWPWLALALAGYLTALGDHFLVWPLLRHLPLFSGIRFPEKFALLFLFPVVVASAYGMDRTVLGPPKAHVGVRWVLAGLAVLGVTLATGLFLLSGRWHQVFPARLAARDALHIALVALAALAVLGSARRLSRRSRGLAFCGLAALDLLAGGQGLAPTTSVAQATRPPDFLAPLVAQPRDDLLFHMAAWQRGLSDMGGLAAPPIPAQWGLATTLEADFDFTQLRWTSDGTRLIVRTLGEDPTLAEPLLRRRGVTALLRFRPGARWQDNRVVTPDGRPPVEALFAKSAQPLVFAASRVEIVRGSDGWREAMRRLRDAIPTTACLNATDLASFPGPPAPARVTTVTRAADRMVLDVDAQGPAPSFLAINHTWASGWRALLDGAPVSLLLTDLSLCGLVVPPGKHHIEMEYRDPWLDGGLGISVGAALACLVLVLAGRRR
jgi:hypothetical protein